MALMAARRPVAALEAVLRPGMDSDATAGAVDGSRRPQTGDHVHDLPFGTFTCAACHRTFPKERSDEDALAESAALWGEIPVEEQVVICDDCFKGESGTFGYDLAGLIRLSESRR